MRLKYSLISIMLIFLAILFMGCTTIKDEDLTVVVETIFPPEQKAYNISGDSKHALVELLNDMTDSSDDSQSVLVKRLNNSTNSCDYPMGGFGITITSKGKSKSYGILEEYIHLTIGDPDNPETSKWYTINNNQYTIICELAKVQN